MSMPMGSSSSRNALSTLFCQKNRYKTPWQHPWSKHWHLIDYVIVRACERQDVLLTGAITRREKCWIITSTDPPWSCKIDGNYEIRLTMSSKNQCRVTVQWQCPPTILARSSSTYVMKSRCTLHPHHLQRNQQIPEEETPSLMKMTCNCSSSLTAWGALSFISRITHSPPPKSRDIKNAKLAYSTLRVSSRKIGGEKRLVRSSSWLMQIMWEASSMQQKPFSICLCMYRLKVTLKSKDGSTIQTTNADIDKWWREHFRNLLNQEVPFDEHALDNFPRNLVAESLSRPPTLEEIKTAMKSMKKNKAASSDSIPAEVFKAASPAAPTDG